VFLGQRDLSWSAPRPVTGAAVAHNGDSIDSYGGTVNKEIVGFNTLIDERRDGARHRVEVVVEPLRRRDACLGKLTLVVGSDSKSAYGRRSGEPAR
jgi:hypothetical protein